MSTKHDNVQFYWNDQLMNNDLIKSYTLTHDLFGSASELTMDIFYQVSLGLTNEPHEIVVTINGYAMFRGYIDKITKTFSKNEYTQTINVRDMAQVLVDNSILFPRTYSNKSFKDIISDIWSRNRTIKEIKRLSSSGKQKVYPISDFIRNTEISLPNLNFKYTTEAEGIINKTGKIKEYITRYGQTLFESISELANSIGLYLYNIPGTDIINFHASGNPDPDDPMGVSVSYLADGSHSPYNPYQLVNYVERSLRDNNNVISGEFTTDITSYYKYTKMIGDAGTSMTINNVGLFENSPSSFRNDYLLPDKYKGVTKFKVIENNKCDSVAWSIQGKDLINNALLTQNRTLHNLKYTVSGFSPEGDYPYFPNHVCDINDTWLPGLDKKSFLIYRTEMTGSKTEGLKTKLELCMPSPQKDDLIRTVFVFDEVQIRS